MNQNYNEFNQEKKKAEKFIKGAWPFIIIGILMMWLNGAAYNTAYFIGVALLIVGLVFNIIGISRFTALKKRFKNEVLVKVFQEVIPTLTYQPEAGLEETDVYSLDYLKKADRFHTEDYLEGTIEDVSFISSDVKLEEKHVRHTKDGNQEYYVTYFLGRVFKFDFNKEIIGSLLVLEEGKPQSKGYHQVELESIAFNKKFDTFSLEDLTAFYILTPPVMEAINELEKRHPGKIGITFSNHSVYIAINNKMDTFEIKMYKEIDDSMLESFKNDLLVIRDFVTTLKLNKKLFKK